MKSGYSIFLAALVASLWSPTTQGFGVINQPRQAASISTTSLHASRRREFFGAVKRVALGAGAVVGWRQSLPVANADDSPSTGRIVEVQVANLDGKEGETGTFRIQLRPDWAPRGSARFEVRVAQCVLLSCVYSFALANCEGACFNFQITDNLQSVCLNFTGACGAEFL